MIHPVHAKVPGRGRFRVKGLYNSKSLKESLETRLLEHALILQASASTVTGNILILFSKDVDHRSIALLLNKAIEEISGSIREPGSREKKRVLNLSRPTERIKALPGTLKKKLSQLVSPMEEQKPQPWHLMKPEAVLDHWGADQHRGLSTQVVNQGLQRFGPNVLPEAEPRSKWRVTFKSVDLGTIALIEYGYRSSP
jgi:Ca2+-transporting ATPase